MIAHQDVITENPRIRPGDYYSKLIEITDHLIRRSDSGQVLHYLIGPHVARFRFVNPNLIPTITPAFAHLECSPEPDTDLRPDFEIRFWDSESSGITLEAPPWNRIRGGIVSFTEGDTKIWYDMGSAILYAYNSVEKSGVFWARDHRRIPVSEIASPLRSLFGWWFSSTTLQMIHGGAIGTEYGGVLIVGPGGSGKSTTCSLALESESKTGMGFLADDFCLVDTGDEPCVYSIYGSCKLSPDVIHQFPGLISTAVNPTEDENHDKLICLLNPEYSDRIFRRLPIRAVLTPAFHEGDETSILPMSPVKALAAIVPSTVFILSADTQNAVRKMGNLVRRTPCYRLLLGSDHERIIGSIGDFLRKL